MEGSKTRKNYYQVLGLENNATTAEIDAAYKKLSSEWHPDKNKTNRKEAEQKFHDVCEAYDVLSNKNRRSHYDEISHKKYTNEDADKTFERFFD
jgi:DnaJ-class molecular chaperone